MQNFYKQLILNQIEYDNNLNKYSNNNGILLCSNHLKLCDTDILLFPMIEKLK